MSLFGCFGCTRRSKKSQRKMDKAISEMNVYMSLTEDLEKELTKIRHDNVQDSTDENNNTSAGVYLTASGDFRGRGKQIAHPLCKTEYNFGASSAALVWLDNMEKYFYNDIVDNSRAGRYEFPTRARCSANAKKTRSLGALIQRLVTEFRK